MLDYFKSLFEYNQWANHVVHDQLRSLDRPPDRASAIMNHIMGAEFLWLARLKGEAQPMAVWPELGFTEQHRIVADIKDAWSGYIESLVDADLDVDVEYVNSKGEPWTNKVRDILMHIVMHSSYHRGQIASTLRDAGVEPVYTDFIQAIRTGALKR